MQIYQDFVTSEEYEIIDKLGNILPEIELKR